MQPSGCNDKNAARALEPAMRGPGLRRVQSKCARSALAFLAALALAACAPEPPRNLFAIGELLSKVRISKANHATFFLELGRVRTGGEAWEAGFRNGDYIVGVNGRKFQSYAQGVGLLSEVDASPAPVIEVSRSGNLLRIECPPNDS